MNSAIANITKAEEIPPKDRRMKVKTVPSPVNIINTAEMPPKSRESADNTSRAITKMPMPGKSSLLW